MLFRSFFMRHLPTSTDLMTHSPGLLIMLLVESMDPNDDVLYCVQNWDRLSLKTLVSLSRKAITRLHLPFPFKMKGDPAKSRGHPPTRRLSEDFDSSRSTASATETCQHHNINPPPPGDSLHGISQITVMAPRQHLMFQFPLSFTFHHSTARMQRQFGFQVAEHKSCPL